MRLFRKIVTVLLVITFWIALPQNTQAASTVPLGTADSFAILAGTTITNVPTSVITGNVGLSPATGAAIGLTCAELTGVLYDDDGLYTGGGGGSTSCRLTDASLLTTAKNDLVTAYDNAAGQTATTSYGSVDNTFGGKTLTPGVFAFGHAATANLTGTLILDGQADPNAVFIFQASSDLITASSSVVTLVNGAQACNVFWQVTSSATLGTSSTFVGTIMALTSIGLNTNATLNGRALARNAAVTLDHNTITRPTCDATAAAASIAAAAAAAATPTPSAATTTPTAAATTTPAPNLPNTGVGADTPPVPWAIPIAAMVALILIISQRKKQLAWQRTKK